MAKKVSGKTKSKVTRRKHKTHVPVWGWIISFFTILGSWWLIAKRKEQKRLDRERRSA